MAERFSESSSNQSRRPEPAIDASVLQTNCDKITTVNTANSNIYESNYKNYLPSSFDSCTLRSKKRKLQSEIDAFVTYLNSRGPFSDNNTAHNMYRNLNERFTKLKSIGLAEVDEINNEFLTQIRTIHSTLNEAYTQWCTPMIQRDDLQPYDSASNVDINSKASSGKVSLTPSQGWKSIVKK